MVWTVRHRIGEDPAFLCRYSLLAPIKNDFGQTWVERNIVLGIFGFDIIHPPAHKTSLHEQLVVFKIEVVPLKRRDLAHAKAEALGNLYHRAIRFTQRRNNVLELVHCQDDGALLRVRS